MLLLQRRCRSTFTRHCCIILLSQMDVMKVALSCVNSCKNNCMLSNTSLFILVTYCWLLKLSSAAGQRTVYWYSGNTTLNGTVNLSDLTFDPPHPSQSQYLYFTLYLVLQTSQPWLLKLTLCLRSLLLAVPNLTSSSAIAERCRVS